MAKKIKISGGYAAEACRQTGYSRTVFETEKKKKKNGQTLTKGELEVLAKFRELVEEAEKQTEKINELEVNYGI